METVAKSAGRTSFLKFRTNDFFFGSAPRCVTTGHMAAEQEPARRAAARDHEELPSRAGPVGR